MAERHEHGSEIVWATVAWGAALVAGILVGVLIGAFAGVAPGLIFGAVTFILLAWILSRRLGPPADDEVAAHVAHEAAPVAAAPSAAAPAMPAHHHEAHAGTGPTAAISERVRAAARAAGEAARAATDAVTGAQGVPPRPEPEPVPPGPVPPAPIPPEPVPPGPIAVEPERPQGLDAARTGGADDLKKIKGVGPKLEELLHSLGFWHFDQVAGWSAREIAWVDSHLEGFNGRATRDDWVGQAKILAAGGETEFSQRVDKGEVY